MNLNLTSPLCFIKVNTTGTNPKQDRIIEISLIKYNPDDQNNPQKATRRFNPGIEIPQEASDDVNGITQQELENEPFFEEKAQGIYDFIKDCDFIGFNIKEFDLPFLREELSKVGISLTFHNKKIVDLLVMYRRLNPRNFFAAAKQYLGQEYESQQSISSNQYLEISQSILESMISSHNEVDNNIDNLHHLSNRNPSALDLDEKVVLNEDGKPVFNFGKYKGYLVSDVCVNQDPNYFNWLTTLAEFSSDTLWVIKGIVKKAKNNMADAS